MAPRKPPAAPVPEYESGGPRVGVPLSYAFRLGDRIVDRLELWPPNLDAIEMLRVRDDVGPRDILAAMCDHDEATLGFLRWPDVEAALDAARPLLPVDFLPSSTPAAVPLPPAPGDVSPVPVRIPAVPTDLDDDEIALPTAQPQSLDDLLGVSMEGIQGG